MSQTIDLRGEPLARAIEKKVIKEVMALSSKNVSPSIAVVVASNLASAYSYAQLKQKADALGIQLDVLDFQQHATQQHLESVLDELSEDPNVHGIALDLPLSPNLDADRALARIAPNKDIDGLTATNIGLVAAGREAEAILAATPQACIELAETQGSLKGKHVGVVGRGRTVGRPLIYMLLNRHATVTVCHTLTADIRKALAPCDVVIVAVGKPGVISGKHLAAGQLVIDAGINMVGDSLRGDVDTKSAMGKVAAISPVDGGVSPLASAIIFRNLMTAIRFQQTGIGSLPKNPRQQTVTKSLNPLASGSTLARSLRTGK